jgi:hypothetical protein
MNIASLNSFFVYKGGYKLDLMSPPSSTERILGPQYEKLIEKNLGLWLRLAHIQ